MSKTSEDPIPLSVLIVDDEELLVRSCAQILSSEGYTIHTEGRGLNALETFRRQRPDVVLTDLMLPDIDGMQVIREVKKMAPETLVVMITGFATVDSSVEAIRAGAYDYIPKPFTATQLRILIGRAAQQVRLARESAHLRDQLKKHYSFENIIGTSDALQRVLAVVSRVAPTDASVLVTGEPGTGKELIARALHTSSRRSEGPFVVVNCTAFPDSILAAELFGTEREGVDGTGGPVRGALERASGGTIFLEAPAAIGPELQARLAQAIEKRRIRRVGGEAEVPIDVRWVTAMADDPEQAVRDGALRQDLLYRLGVVPVRLPPLRDRREDIPSLAGHYLRRFAGEYERGPLRLSAEAVRVLCDAPWPGNVRELCDVVERVVSLCAPGQEITPEDLPEEVRKGAARHAPPTRENEEFYEQLSKVSHRALAELHRTLSAENRRLRAELDHLRAQPGNAERHMSFTVFGTLVRSMAHDLRNTFEKLIMGLETVAEDPEAPPDVQGEARVLATTAQRGADLFRETERSLDAMSPETTDVDLLPLVHQVRDEAAGQMAPGVSLEVVPPPRGSLRVRSNPHFLKVVLLELVRNAEKALAESGGGRIRVRLRGERDAVAVVVEDDGPGIPRVILDYLRDLGGARPGGIGAGLALSAQLVRGLGGDFRIERSSPEGTSVAVLVPRARRPARQARGEEGEGDA